MIHQIKRQNVRLGYHKILLLERIVTHGSRGGQNAGHPPDALERNETSGVGDPLLLPHLLWLVVERKRNRIALVVAHDTPRVADVRYDQLGVVHYSDESRRTGEVRLKVEGIGTVRPTIISSIGKLCPTTWNNRPRITS